MNDKLNRLAKALGCLLIIVTALMLGGCQLAILNPKGAIAADETRLLIEATLTMLVVVVPALLLTLVFAWRYSAKRNKGKYSPEWSHSTVLEAVWWGIPCIIIIILATITWISTHHLDPYRPIASKKKQMVIQVVALNWKWLFIYPEQHIATVNFVEFPVNTPIEFQLTSDAPMNSFQITQLAGQIYAMAGMRTRLHLIANKPGNYHGLSTSYSGEGFAGMHFIAHVTNNQQDFNAWVSKVKQSKRPLDLTAYQALLKDSQNNPVSYYAPVATGLFQSVISKYMNPQQQHLLPRNPQRQSLTASEINHGS